MKCILLSESYYWGVSICWIKKATTLSLLSKHRCKKIEVICVAPVKGTKEGPRGQYNLFCNFTFYKVKKHSNFSVFDIHTCLYLIPKIYNFLYYLLSTWTIVQRSFSLFLFILHFPLSFQLVPQRAFLCQSFFSKNFICLKTPSGQFDKIFL